MHEKRSMMRVQLMILNFDLLRSLLMGSTDCVIGLYDLDAYEVKSNTGKSGYFPLAFERKPLPE